MKTHFQTVCDPGECVCLPGTILMFWLARPRIQQHLGIVTEPGRFIHAWWDVGKVVEMDLDGIWLKRLDSIYDFRWQR